MNVCIWGKIGSGKTSVARMFGNLGANVISADLLGHEALKYVKDELVLSFGKIILYKGNIDRKRLSESAFCSKRNVLILNNLVHPALIRLIKKKLRKNMVNVIDAALFYELKLDKICNKVILIRSETPWVKDSNLLERQKYIKDVKKYHYVIDNSKNISNTRKQVEEIWQKIRN